MVARIFSQKKIAVAPQLFDTAEYISIVHNTKYTDFQQNTIHIRQGWKKSKFSEWPAEFSVISSDKSKNFLLKKFLKILQNGGAHGGSKPFMRELLPP